MFRPSFARAILAAAYGREITDESDTDRAFRVTVVALRGRGYLDTANMLSEMVHQHQHGNPIDWRWFRGFPADKDGTGRH